VDTCKVINTNNGRTVIGDILQRSDKRIRVALQGTNMTLTMTRDDVRRPYVGNAAGLEFTTMG